MALKIFAILVALFTISFTILGLQNPYFLDIKSYSLDFKNIEANSLKAYELNTTFIKSYYEANSWIRYSDKDVFEDFKTFNLDFNLSAKSLEVSNENFNKVLFQGDVVYRGIDELQFFSQKVEYFPKKKILNTDVGFKALVNGSAINGSTLKYDLENKILKIQGVDAWLQVE
ncbi:hypothetical protein OQH60_00320 [Campylobacter sp. MIT 21-1685]|uniref:hypothetical protein n=1 Tax=unclassified Campylobacter TaxID=2593542 RepID=UPI00224AD1A3|nr:MULTISPECIES: hypothetical protein [unclassified Campylobacter]MCX2682370.1 hypothetical protein [Campylobacter sp. MIT 21-1684]MCX2750650.1 hypothetical protein [Campylobacter sp. MIT 21-1682]MCX2806802.1 hypothetical protein [Campylobacter sp. MIT 21-1685]